MDLTCLEIGWRKLVSQLTWNMAEDTILGSLGMGLLLSLLLAPVVLALYQRRIVKLMKAWLPGSSQQSLLSPQTPPSAEQPLPSDRDRPATVPEAVIAAGEKRRGALQKSLNWSVGVFAVLDALAFLITPNEPGELQTRTLSVWMANAVDGVLYLVFVLCLCAPITLLGVANTRFKRLFWLRLAPIYSLVLIILLLLEAITPEVAVAMIGSIVVLYLGLGGRRARNVVPLLMALMFPAIAILYLYSETVQVIIETCQDAWIARLLFALLLAGMCLAVMYAHKMIGLLTRAYERKRISTAQIQIGSWLLIIAAFLFYSSGSGENSWDWWSLGMLVALAASLWVYQRLLSRIKPSSKPRKLLLLRVFSKDRRGEKLLDEVSFHWRFIGPIYLIAGPDLAKSTLEPHVLHLFLRRRLKDLFISNLKMLSKRMDKIDDKPDPDARFRIYDFFCFDNVWTQAVEGLLSRAESVLIDLRDFNVSRQGTSFEIELLARHGAFARSVILANKKTDWTAVNQVLSRVPGAVIPDGRIWQSDRKMEVADIIRALVSSDMAMEKI